MTRDDDLRIRPGRIRQTGGRSDTALRQILVATQRAGGPGRASASRSSVFGRGRTGSVRALRGLGASSRSVVIKSRVVRHRAGTSPLSAHLRYLQRDGVTSDGKAGRLFDAETDRANVSGFGERCDGDRHHFRFIVSPEDGADLQDLKAFTRDLMRTAEADLQTRLDWVAVDHWNTPHPHVHLLVRGVADDGQDLVIARDYISQGLRGRACALATLELGPRSERDLNQSLARQTAQDRLTGLDGRLVREAAREDGVLDLRPGRDRADPLRHLKLERIATLQRLGLAEPEGKGRWRLKAGLENVLRSRGRQAEILDRVEAAARTAGVERPYAQVEKAAGTATIIGRVLDQGLDDELKGSGYLVIDGLDGRLHYEPVPDLHPFDVRPGAIVEVAPLGGDPQSDRRAVFVRSDLPIESQVSAEGATWLDRQLVRGDRSAAATGFAQDVAFALERRIDHLQTLGLARRDAGSVRLGRNLLDTLRDREIAATSRKIAAETGLAYRPSGDGEDVAGVYRRRVTLATGRFAMIDDGLGFTLVPWRPSLDRRLGQSVSGTIGAGLSVTWTMRRGPGR